MKGEKGGKVQNTLKLARLRKGLVPENIKMFPKENRPGKGCFPQDRLYWNSVPLFLLRLYNFQPAACIFHNLAFPMLAVARLDWSGRDIPAGSIILE